MMDERPTEDQLNDLPAHTVLGIHSYPMDQDFWWYRQDDGDWFLIGSLAVTFESAELLDLYIDCHIWPEAIPTALMDGLYVAGYSKALDDAVAKIEDLSDKQEKDEYGTYVEGYNDALNDVIVALEENEGETDG